MHPSVAARYGLKPEDVPFAEAHIADCRRHGRDPEPGLCWWRDHGQHMAGRASPVEIAESFRAYAERAGVSDGDIEMHSIWHEKVDRGGPQAIEPLPVNKGQDAEVVARAEYLLKHDRKAYFGDENLQVAYAEALARQNGSGPAPSQAPAAARMSREQYWKTGPGSLPLASSDSAGHQGASDNLSLPSPAESSDQ